MRKKISGVMLFTILLSPITVKAVDNLRDNLSFKGNLIIPNCTINYGSQIETDWGDVEIQTLKRPHTPTHEKELNIPVTCPYSLGTPKMKISGAAHIVAGQSGLKTSKYDEGLLIYMRTKAAGSWVSYNAEKNIPADSISGSGSNKILTMYVSLGFYKTMEELKPGPFTAGATLEIRYE
ncbi:fimbrial protein [Escherichia coli]|nr:fimbrial protein [Escherichia coli]